MLHSPIQWRCRVARLDISPCLKPKAGRAQAIGRHALVHMSGTLHYHGIQRVDLVASCKESRVLKSRGVIFCETCRLRPYRLRSGIVYALPDNVGGGGRNSGYGGVGDGGDDDHDEGARFPIEEGSALLKTHGSVMEDIVILDVTGMRCAGCVSRVKQILLDEECVLGASVNLATETAVVRVVMPGDVDIEVGEQGRLEELGEQLAQILTEKGYKATFRPLGSGTSAASKVVKAKREERIARLREKTFQVVVSWGLASACMLHHIVHWFGNAAPPFLKMLSSTMGTAALSAVAILGPGRSIIVDGFKSLAKGAPDMNSLVGLGVTAAFGISSVAVMIPKLGWRTFFEEPAMLLGFILLGRALEERAKIQASSDMAALSGLLPPMARVVLSDGTSWREIPSENVSQGDLVTILPGDQIPVDGEVVRGRSTCDESSITGESLPVNKSQGDTVTAGTTNFDGTLVVRCTASGGDAAVSNIVNLVETAQGRTAPIQRLSDIVAGKFAYGVMGVAAATFLFWSGFGAKMFPRVLETSLSGGASKAAATIALSLQLACNVLVVACPCALGLAAPTAVLVGTGAGARRGLLIRGGDVLEAASNVDTIVFDKTGTLTTGKPTVVRVITDDNVNETECLSYAAAIEENSSHPIAHAIVQQALADTQIPQRQVSSDSFNQVPGKGAEGIVDGKNIYVGNLDWVMQKTGASSSAEGLHTAKLNPGHTVVYVGMENNIVGSIEIADQVRHNARQVLKKLKESGITPVMLSGDQQTTSQHVASQLGIDTENVIAGVTPIGKVDAINNLKAKGHIVAMVGDGVNDAAALAEANVGIAMGGGVAVASEVADIVLLGDRLPQVIDTFRLSKMTMNTIRQNMAWAFGYNMICLPLAAGVMLPINGLGLTPALSGALMGCSSLAVMANSLLLQVRASKIKS
ncbi:hypothetical protein M9434_003679 [Picochlorum sp. BPE23]|nr:hypothetical protein M9434_003679 [Picochlorum sp. BPE23]